LSSAGSGASAISAIVASRDFNQRAAMASMRAAFEGK
jgi:hypothetical protein